LFLGLSGYWKEKITMTHIIIVEEEPILLKLFMHLVALACSSFTKISGVSNGQQALEVYDEMKADLIISDYKMPVMDGSQLLRTLRSRGVTIPIIITSGNPLLSDHAYKAGATLFVEKIRLKRTLPKIMGYLLL
jgi:CheY-like chemotaxis protein